MVGKITTPKLPIHINNDRKMKESSVIQGCYHSIEQIMTPFPWALKTPSKGFTPGKQGGIKQLIGSEMPGRPRRQVFLPLSKSPSRELRASTH